METITIEIIEPSAKKILLDLEAKKQIQINNKVIEQLKSLEFEEADEIMSMDEIVALVKEVRQEIWDEKLVNENHS